MQKKRNLKVIALNGDYNYIDKIETTLKSIFSHNQDVEVHIINSDIPHEWFININRYVKQLNSKVIDEKIDSNQLSTLP